MNSIEMTDVDGDALSVISREGGTWISCTSGPDEVTVGPFPARLVRGAFTQVIETDGDASATLLGRSAPARTLAELPPGGRERAWETFRHRAETSSLREALDAALAAALTAPGRPAAAEELADELRHASFAVDDAGVLADHLVALGYRKEQ